MRYDGATRTYKEFFHLRGSVRGLWLLGFSVLGVVLILFTTEDTRAILWATTAPLASFGCLAILWALVQYLRMLPVFDLMKLAETMDPYRGCLCDLKTGVRVKPGNSCVAIASALLNQSVEGCLAIFGANFETAWDAPWISDPKDGDCSYNPRGRVALENLRAGDSYNLLSAGIHAPWQCLRGVLRSERDGPPLLVYSCEGGYVVVSYDDMTPFALGSMR